MNKTLQATLNNVMLIVWQQNIWLDKTEEMRDEEVWMGCSTC
jgi:hypothetical protein